MSSKELTVAQKQFEMVTKEDVRKYFCDKATEKEVGLFLQIAKLNGLNPFLREIYLIKYGTYPASIVTGYETYLKRAERSGKYSGFKVWCEGTVGDGTLVAKIEVYRKDWVKPLTHEVEYSEYVGKKADGKPTKFWAEKPKTMLKKVVISQGFRFAFPDELGGMPYTSEEMNTMEAEVVPVKQPSVTIPKVKTTEDTPVDFPVEFPSDDDEEIPTPEEPPTPPPPARESSDDRLISEPQRKRLFAISKQSGWAQEEVKAYLMDQFGTESTKDIKRSDYETICTHIESNKVV